MAEKDFYEKKLEDYNDVFADIVNVLLFNGENKVQERDLETGMVRSSYRMEGKHEEQERDSIKYWKDGQIRIAAYAFENQTGKDDHFPIRGIAYDGANYRDQIRQRDDIRRRNAERGQEGQALLPLPDFYPVVTLVLYFGEERWRGSVRLKDHLKIPAGLEDFVSDYNVQVFEIAYLSDELIQKFQSDFRIVAEYFTGNRKKKEGLIDRICFSDVEMKHFAAVMDLLRAVTGSNRFERTMEVTETEEGAKVVWKTYIDYLAEEREAIGEIRGSIRTYKKGMNLSPSQIVPKIMEDYSLSKENAEDYVKQTLELEKV